MTSNDIYTPFTYCITFIPTGKRYYGVRYAKDCHPEQLWTTYFTSSVTIADLIKEHGKESFTSQVRKTFITAKQARSWETKFLTRISAAQSPEWLNGNNGSATFHSTPESVQKTKETKKRRNSGMNNPIVYQKMVNTRKENGLENPMKNPESVLKHLATRAKNGTLNNSSPESIQKFRDTCKEKGIENAMKNPETIQKAKDSKKERGTGMDNPIVLQKMMDTKKERGIINPALIPFLSMIHNKKTYARCHISKHFPDLKQYY
jgi:hypothetical protein